MSAPVESGRSAFVFYPWTPGGGLASADMACDGEAARVGLGGTFRALLATSTASAASRFDLGGANWVRTDGVPIADSPTDFMAARTRVAIELAADGSRALLGSVWTGASTSFGGDESPADPIATTPLTCADWTSSLSSSSGGTGLASRAGSELYDYVSVPCSDSWALYCLEL